KLALPGTIGARIQVLHGAAAAYAEMRTDRRNARWARVLDPQQLPPVGMAGNGFHLHGFAGQGASDEDRFRSAVNYAVAMVTKTVDGQMLNHAAPRSETRG